jgi:cytoskeletal protein CcmA (bactofilin family)
MKKQSQILTALLVLVLLFGVATPAQAQGIIAGDTVPAGTTVEDDVVLFGDTVTIDGNVDGNVYALGGTVTVNGKVDGSLYTIGQQVLVNGEVTDGVYGTGLELTFGPSGKVDRNVAFLGLSVGMPSGSTIGRDLTGIFALGATFGGNVGRDTTAIIGPLEVVRLIIRLFNIQAPAFLSPQTSSHAAMKLASPVAFHPQQGIIDSFRLQRWLLSTVREYIGLLLIGLLAIWLLPGHLRRWGDKIRRAPFSSLGVGLTAIIVGYVGLLLLWVLLMAIALGIGKIGFGGIGAAIGMLASFGIGTAGAIFFVIVMYLSKVIFAFQVGFMILKKYDRVGFWFKLGVLALGLLIYVLLAAIPYIGWAIAVVIMLLGTGAVFLIYNEDRRFEKSTVETPVPGETASSTPPAVTPSAEKPVEAAPVMAAAVDAQSAETPIAPVVEPMVESRLAVETPVEEGTNEPPPADIPAADKPVKTKASHKGSKSPDE